MTDAPVRANGEVLGFCLSSLPGLSGPGLGVAGVVVAGCGGCGVFEGSGGIVGSYHGTVGSLSSLCLGLG
ncbi:Uncharacterised protein [Corynebacterium pseudotuberculosis]|nr:hypothetical protein C8E98_0350 [Corynebacterium pseudotuberculosis]VTQ79272.1 Uncharacterised protein [Corynebacterium pseudotuberculosis]